MLSIVGWLITKNCPLNIGNFLLSTLMKVYNDTWSSNLHNNSRPEWHQSMNKFRGKWMLERCGQAHLRKTTKNLNLCKDNSYLISIWTTTMMLELVVKAKKLVQIAGNLCLLPNKYLLNHWRKILDFINSCLSSQVVVVCIFGFAMNKHVKCLTHYVNQLLIICKLWQAIVKAQHY